MDHGQCWCLLIDDSLLSSTVIASYLFKREWAACVHILGIEDINDTRHGLPLWKSLEWAVDSLWLWSTYNRVNLITLGYVRDYCYDYHTVAKNDHESAHVDGSAVP